ncbi:MAG TPA: tripartite tricarboxylate transporter permease [Luteitalea sp.]|nr:tripartite tricarboxylate transporter permease [Luteitalea sp.]
MPDPSLLLAPLLSFDAWLYVLIGVGLGVLFGSLPGFTATMGLAVLTPFTFWVKADQAIAMLLGLLVSAIFSGGVPAILLNTPGTPASIAMTWDGHPLARQGKAGLALGLNAIGAFLGIFLSLVVLLLAALPLSRLALRFGPAEYFAVAVFGLSTIVGVSGGSMWKGMATGLIGLLLAVIGLDSITGYPRFTFGQPELLDGVSFIPVMVGLFGIAEVLTQMAGPARQQLDGSAQTSGMLPTMAEARPLWAHGLRGSLMGIWIGIMPAAGADVGAILAWDQSRRFSKTPELFGKGSLEGLIAATTGANAGIGGSLVTTLALGIPGDSAAAVLIGALLMHGLQPGPLLFRNRPDLVATIVALVFMASLVTLVWGLIGARLLAKILRIRDQFLWATVLAVSLGGSYALNQSTGDVWTAVAAGIFGFALRRQGFPMGPLVLGLILGPMAESNLRRALALSEGSLATFVTRPISLVFLVLAALTLLWPLFSKSGTDSRLPDSSVPDADTL